MRIVSDIFREKRVDPIAAAKNISPLRIAMTTPTELIALQAVCDVVVPKGFRVRIEPGYALLSAEPELAKLDLRECT